VREFFRPHLNGPLRSRARSVLARHAVSGDHP
jgi:hypothetical protein